MPAEKRTCVATAPCSTANLGPGYDVFGLALDALYDRVTITRLPAKDGKIEIKVTGAGAGVVDIPLKAEENSAGLVVRNMATELGLKDSLDILVEKGVPPGYGMGSSGASAAAAAFAFDYLFDLNTPKNKLVEYAAEGEKASAGSVHFDNVSASLLGGFVISRISATPVKQFIRIGPPRNLCVIVAVPNVKVPKRKTEVARSVLPKDVGLDKVVHNVSAASAIVAGFAFADIEMIASGIDDCIIEPARKQLITGYEEVRSMALKAGALAVTISGAGPSMLSILNGRVEAEDVAEAMQGGFKKAGVESQVFVCAPSEGAKILP